MARQFSTPKDIILKLESVGLQLLPRASEAFIQGHFAQEQRDVLQALLPEINRQWEGILDYIYSRDENEVAHASIQMLARSGNESAAAALGILGWLEGGCPKENDPHDRSARDVARERWGQGKGDETDKG